MKQRRDEALFAGEPILFYDLLVRCPLPARAITSHQKMEKLTTQNAVDVWEEECSSTPVRRFIIRPGILRNKGMPSNYPSLMDFPAGYKPFIFEIP